MAEAGLAGFAATGYIGVMTTGGTRREVVAKLNAAINEVIREPDVAAHFAALGYEMTGGTAEEFAAFLREETARYARVIRAIGTIE